jgi:hypothetical protein
LRGFQPLPNIRQLTPPEKGKVSDKKRGLLLSPKTILSPLDNVKARKGGKKKGGES